MKHKQNLSRILLSSERKLPISSGFLTPQSSRGADVNESHMRNTAAGQPRAKKLVKKLLQSIKFKN